MLHWSCATFHLHWGEKWHSGKPCAPRHQRAETWQGPPSLPLSPLTLMYHSQALWPPRNCRTPVLSHSIYKRGHPMPFRVLLATKGLTDVKTHSEHPPPYMCDLWFSLTKQVSGLPISFCRKPNHLTNNSFHITASLKTASLQLGFCCLKENACHPFWCKRNLLASYIKGPFHLNGEEILIIDYCFMNMKIIYSLHNQPFNWHIVASPMECVEQIWNHVTNRFKASFRKQEACYLVEGRRNNTFKSSFTY